MLTPLSIVRGVNVLRASLRKMFPPVLVELVENFEVLFKVHLRALIGSVIVLGVFQCRFETGPVYGKLFESRIALQLFKDLVSEFHCWRL